MVVSKTLPASAELVQSVRAQRASRALSPSPPSVSENAALSPSSSLTPAKSVRAETLLAAQEVSHPREGRRRAYAPPDVVPRHAAREAPPSQDRAALRRETVRHVAEQQNQAADTSNRPSGSAVAPGERNVSYRLQPSPANATQIPQAISPEPSNGGGASSPPPGAVKNAAVYAQVSSLYQATHARLGVFGEGSTSNTSLDFPPPSPIDISA
ncbi:hypothetical protein EDD55_102419 [Varunaivibrio sulfuroxidans]|uniref:Uncharacterized protein n=1 Tax=Varunaivibrio sulfuroxidans TaxID=1773489 RepID=A0A4R3JEX3_9PROT|nr:hypothetical protein EDD55_102419 [Varunaivibrio sulfuroxidans]